MQDYILTKQNCSAFLIESQATQKDIADKRLAPVFQMSPTNSPQVHLERDELHLNSKCNSSLQCHNLKTNHNNIIIKCSLLLNY